ncbi:MAG TPA: HIT family protein [Sphingomonadaceae bacterium]|nr:HIT family protein [Sphingomonadaceae bacterium]
MVNATIVKFGYPATRVAETDDWVILLRPQAVTLGSLVLAAKSEATSFGALPPRSFTDLAQATAKIEAALIAFVEYEKINYLMLMMVDPHIHFHVVPRYQGTRSFKGLDFPDVGWPGMPALSASRALDTATTDAMVGALRGCGLT